MIDAFLVQRYRSLRDIAFEPPHGPEGAHKARFRMNSVSPKRACTGDLMAVGGLGKRR